MKAIKSILETRTKNAEVLDELSFHLGDIALELVEVGALMSQIVDGKQIRVVEMDRIIDCLQYHWPYHIEEMRPHWETLEEESDEE